MPDPRFQFVLYFYHIMKYKLSSFQLCEFWIFFKADQRMIVSLKHLGKLHQFCLISLKREKILQARLIPFMNFEIG